MGVFRESSLEERKSERGNNLYCFISTKIIIYNNKPKRKILINNAIHMLNEFEEIPSWLIICVNENMIKTVITRFN